MALQVARRQARLGEQRSFESCTSAIFTGTALREGPSVGPRKSVIVEVGGVAHITGESRFRFDADDPLRGGFSLSS
jgi:trans-L-3-hydroxyproline dehydratase